MDDLFDYLKWRGDIPFTQVPLTPVDGLIFSALAYIDFQGLVPGDWAHPVPLSVASQAFLALPDGESRCRVPNDRKLLEAAAHTLRFRDCRLVCYQQVSLAQVQTQFAAVTFLLPDATAVLAFRGTDHSVVGWKEDFNMSFQQSVPAQLKAASYVMAFTRQMPGVLHLCGHSKGGNLAVFAGAKAEPPAQGRIVGIYNFDGPGFTEPFLSSPGYGAILPRIHTYIPQASIVGMLMDRQEPYSVIKSSQVSLLQHEPYSWNIHGGDFVHTQEISGATRLLDRTIKNWIAGLDAQERCQVVDTFYGLLTAGGADQVGELAHPKTIQAAAKELSANDNKRRLVQSHLAQLLQAAITAATELKKQNEGENTHE